MLASMVQALLARGSRCFSSNLSTAAVHVGKHVSTGDDQFLTSELSRGALVKDVTAVPLVPTKEMLESWESLPGRDKSWQAVTKLLTATEPEEQKQRLEAWMQRMINSLGEEGYKIMNEKTLNEGKEFHNAVAMFMKGVLTLEQINPRPGHGDKFWKSFVSSAEIKKIRPLHTPRVETWVEHPALKYFGVLDAIAEYNGILCMIDWKTSGKSKVKLSDLYDYPLQVAAYAGAWNADPRCDIKVSSALVAIAYSNGDPANVVFLDEPQLTHYWDLWLARVKMYYDKDGGGVRAAGTGQPKSKKMSRKPSKNTEESF